MRLQADQEGGGVSLSGDMKNLCPHVPVQPALGGPALQGGWTRWSPEVPYNPITILALCEFFKVTCLMGADSGHVSIQANLSCGGQTPWTTTSTA